MTDAKQELLRGKWLPTQNEAMAATALLVILPPMVHRQDLADRRDFVEQTLFHLRGGLQQYSTTIYEGPARLYRLLRAELFELSPLSLVNVKNRRSVSDADWLTKHIPDIHRRLD